MRRANSWGPDAVVRRVDYSPTIGQAPYGSSGALVGKFGSCEELASPQSGALSIITGVRTIRKGSQ